MDLQELLDSLFTSARSIIRVSPRAGVNPASARKKNIQTRRQCTTF